MCRARSSGKELLLGTDGSKCQLTSTTTSNWECKGTMSKIFMMITCNGRSEKGGHAVRSEVSLGKQGAICFDEFSKVQGLKLCFYLRNLVNSGNEHRMPLWQGTGEGHTLCSTSPEIYIHKNANLQWEIQEHWDLSVSMAGTILFRKQIYIGSWTVKGRCLDKLGIRAKKVKVMFPVLNSIRLWQPHMAIFTSGVHLPPLLELHTSVLNCAHAILIFSG